MFKKSSVLFSKAKSVIKGVAKRLGLTIIDETENNENDVDKQNKELAIVKNFYYRPDIVYTCLGMRDSMAIWKDGKKITLQRHYLTLFLHEAFAIFKQDSPNIKLGFSKFCSLQPDNVLLLSQSNFWDDILSNVSLNETSTGELFEKTKEDFIEFFHHVSIKRIQSDAFLNDKNNPSVRILQIDFAMSYSCENQNEVQSALWARSSVTLFTAASFFKNECKSYVICSDCHHKDKDTVFVFVNHIYDLIMANCSDSHINDVIWSDELSSEFKNKFMVRLLQYLFKKHNKSFWWKYFATSHGKGVVDGNGGNLKRLVKQKTMSQGGGVIVQSAQDFANLAATLVPSTKVIYISEAEINSEIAAKKPWTNTETILFRDIFLSDSK
ncbi:hypothetical protein ILUMI_10164 [Ignelater luminosus]|uniref:Uncharacterized protein n=1 Tax=Ignelater luminosus TaxID=2038154 RepID=A0A8K0D4F6_IGNLU|nr:hypothetical protein ILUMI_10164 [Ignelater luminosus]